MSLLLNDQAFLTAAEEMAALKERNQALHDKLEKMYKDLTTALDTPAGHEMEWTGREVLLAPIEDMGLVIKHMSDTLHMIIGQTSNGEASSKKYYKKLFEEFEELELILKNKTTNRR